MRRSGSLNGLLAIVGLHLATACGDSSVTVDAGAADATVDAAPVVYVLGGNGSGGALFGALDSVETAKVNADGSLSAFSTLPGLFVKARSGLASTVQGSSLYLIGGRGGAPVGSGGDALNTVERAEINADGSLGAFATKSDVITAEARDAFASAVAGSFIYVFGGSDGNLGDVLDRVELASVDTSGNLGIFATVGHLVTTRQSPSSAVVGSSLYVIGGSDAGVGLDSLERATINADGTLSPMAIVPGVNLVTRRTGHTSIVIKNFVTSSVERLATRQRRRTASSARASTRTIPWDRSRSSPTSLW